MWIDARLRHFAQVSYDYLLDRWSIPLGLALQTLLVLNFGLNLMRTGEVNWLIAIFCTILIGYHELIHVRLQKMRAYFVLNAVAQKWEARWFLRMVLWTTITTQTLASTMPDISKTLIGLGESACWIMWYTAWCVHLRDRDDTRFRSFSTASLDTGTRLR